MKDIFGPLATQTTFEGRLGRGEGERLHVYLMSRMRGVTHLDFVLAHDVPENSPENFNWRKNLIGDVAHFMALCWNSSRHVSSEYRIGLRQTYVKDLQALSSALPYRFKPVIQTCIDSVDNILSLPMVLLHKDFGACNIIVDPATCNLVGVIDWAEAEVCPFGLNLHSLESLSGKLDLRDGWTRFEDYDTLQNVFWDRFKQKVGGLTDDQLQTVQLARALGVLLSHGFTSRLANEPDPAPIGDNEYGRYNTMSLDAFLLLPPTKLDGSR
ncbi:hypothetical protein RJ55_06950 [Drechmeria coniospora]|nr:hypothetical protein RJ55_06950 [Drechmeria coniospora]